MGAPSYTVGNVSTCDTPFVLVQTATLGPGLNFIIILIVCILLLLILVIAIVFYRRRRRFVEEKADPHDDIRETFVNYDGNLALAFFTGTNVNEFYILNFMFIFNR